MSDDEEQKQKQQLDAPSVDEDESRAAAEQGQHVCPSCGDWLPLELKEFRCAGKGHHYAVSRTSIYPEGPAQRELKRAAQPRSFGGWLGDFLLVLFIVIFITLIFTVLLSDGGKP